MNRRTYLAAATGVTLSLAGCADRISRTKDGDDTGPSDGPSTGGGDGDDRRGEETDPAVGTADDFEDLSAWTTVGGSLAADPSRAVVGSQSARLEVPAERQTGGLERTFSEPRDLRGVAPGVAVESTDVIVPWLRLVDDGGDAIGYRRNVSDAVPLQRYSFGVDSVDPGFDAGSVREVQLLVWTHEGESETVWFDDLFFAPRPETGRVMIQFDDAHVTDYTEALPILERYDYPAVTFVNSEYIDGGDVGGDPRLTTDQLRELHDAGWCIANHAASHPRLPELERAEQEAEIREGQAWLRERGFEDGADYFAYPFGEYDATTVDIVDEYHALSFAGGLPAHGHVANTALAPRIGDPEADRVRREIERTAELGGITSVFYHRLEGDDLASFEAMVETIREHESRGDLEVVLPQDVEREFLY